MNNQENQAVEIDVFAMLKTLWKRKFSIVLVALVFAIAAFGYSAFLAKKEYQSTSRIYVVSRQNQDNNALTNSDLQAGSYLVKDYREIILSQNVLSQAIEELKLDMTPAELSKRSVYPFQQILVSFRSRLRTEIQKKQLVLPTAFGM